MTIERMGYFDIATKLVCDKLDLTLECYERDEIGRIASILKNKQEESRKKVISELKSFIEKSKTAKKEIITNLYDFISISDTID